MTAVFIVEDDVFINMEASFVVGELGHATHNAHDYEAGLTILQSNSSIDVLFTDIRLKERRFGGYGLAKEAVVLRPSLGVLYTTGDTLAHPDTGLVMEDAHFLQKPYGEEQLRMAFVALQQTLQARRPSA